MSEETKKQLTEEELARIQEIKKRMVTATDELGQIGLAEINLEKRRDNVETFLDETKAIEKKLVKELTDKYGNGSINLDTGEIS